MRGLRNNKQKSTKKRGISPIVAIVLLIAIAIIAAIGIYYWASGLVTKQPTSEAPIPVVANPVGNGKVLIANLGTKTLNTSTIKTSDPGVSVTCDSPTLGPGEQTLCTLSGTSSSDTITIYGTGTSSAWVDTTAAGVYNETGGGGGTPPGGGGGIGLYITNVVDNTTNGVSLGSIEINATVVGATAVTCILDDPSNMVPATNLTDTLYTCTFSGLSDGTHMYIVNATNGTAQVYSNPVWFEVNSSYVPPGPPYINITEFTDNLTNGYWILGNTLHASAKVENTTAVNVNLTILNDDGFEVATYPMTKNGDYYTKDLTLTDPSWSGNGGYIQVNATATDGSISVTSTNRTFQVPYGPELNDYGVEPDPVYYWQTATIWAQYLPSPDMQNIGSSIGTVWVTHNASGVPEDVVMTYNAANDRYEATIAPVQPGTVEYTLHANDTYGHLGDDDSDSFTVRGQEFWIKSYDFGASGSEGYSIGIDGLDVYGNSRTLDEGPRSGGQSAFGLYLNMSGNFTSGLGWLGPSEQPIKVYNSNNDWEDGLKKLAGRSGSNIFVANLNDTDLSMLWNKTYTGSFPSGYARNVEETNDGGAIVAGYISTSTGDISGFLMRIDGSGNVVWAKNISYSNTDVELYDLAMSPDSTTARAYGSFNNSDLLVFSFYTSNGTLIYAYTYNVSLGDLSDQLYLEDSVTYTLVAFPYANISVERFDVGLLVMDNFDVQSFTVYQLSDTDSFVYNIQNVTDTFYVSVTNGTTGGFLSFDTSGNLGSYWLASSTTEMYGIDIFNDQVIYAVGANSAGKLVVVRANNSVPPIPGCGDIVQGNIISTYSPSVTRTSIGITATDLSLTVQDGGATLSTPPAPTETQICYYQET